MERYRVGERRSEIERDKFEEEGESLVPRRRWFLSRGKRGHLFSEVEDKIAVPRRRRFLAWSKRGHLCSVCEGRAGGIGHRNKKASVIAA